jgi:hypothetical protein
MMDATSLRPLQTPVSLLGYLDWRVTTRQTSHCPPVTAAASKKVLETHRSSYHLTASQNSVPTGAGPASNLYRHNMVAAKADEAERSLSSEQKVNRHERRQCFPRMSKRHVQSAAWGAEYRPHPTWKPGSPSRECPACDRLACSWQRTNR